MVALSLSFIDLAFINWLLSGLLLLLVLVLVGVVFLAILEPLLRGDMLAFWENGHILT